MTILSLHVGSAYVGHAGFDRSQSCRATSEQRVYHVGSILEPPS